jgi:enoyl-CoA hydratase
MSVDLEIAEGIAHIVLNRPDKLNAINGPMLDVLEHSLDTIEERDDVRAVLLSGRGRAFSAGFDLGGDGPRDPDSVRRELERDFDVIMRFWDCSKPTIAAVHGYCLGSSMEIAAVCDITIAAADSRFGAPEVKYGSGIVCLVLPWLVGLKNAKELLLTGDNDVDAERAQAMGLVNRIVDPDALAGESLALARRIAANDALAVQLTKKAINRGAEIGGLRRALEEALEIDVQIETTETPESREFNTIMQSDGLKAALDWRAGKSTGR